MSAHEARVLGNLLRPWLLSRIVASGVTAIAAVAVVVLVAEVLRARRLAQTSEGGLVLERRAELVATLFTVGAMSSIVSLALAVLGADRLSGSIRGAMCAWGVLDATPWGMRSLAVSAVTALGAASWLALHRLGLGLRVGLLRLELFAALGLAPLALLDVGLSVAHTLALDFRVVASCCSSGLEDARAVAEASGGGPRTLVTVAFFGAGLVALGLSLVAARRPSVGVGRAAALATFAAGLAAIPTVTWWVAPHAYGSPAHLCPFCLLHAEAHYVGYPLGALLFVALARGLGLGAYAVLAARTPTPGALDADARALARGGSFAWAALLVVAALPWAVYTLEAGGASLFGGAGG